jgi:oligoribonuclease
LFHDCIKSKFTKQQVVGELLALLKRHCPEKKCSLAGSSIHIDKEVLKRCMPTVHDYLHYRIIDVSTLQAVMRRWAPWMESEIKSQLATNGQEEVKHRAMDDIEWSIAFMKMFRPHLGKQK